MLSANEFTVGALANAAPLSLILPRIQYEAAVLIGSYNDAPVAVFLSGQFAFSSFPSIDNTSWKGMIVPNVRVEIDPASLFNGDGFGGALGSLTRIDTRLVVWAKRDRSYDSVGVTLHQGLTPCAEGYSAGFKSWQVVIGDGQDKRVLWRVPNETEAISPNGPS